MDNTNPTYPVCDTHKEALEARLGDRVRFYPTDNTPILGNYTLCEAHLTGCKAPATHRYTLVMQVEVVGDITLASDYWDCECEQDYIHAKVDGDVVQSCNICGSDMEDWPNSRLNEVLFGDSQIIDGGE